MEDFVIWHRTAPGAPPKKGDFTGHLLYAPAIEPVGGLPYELAGLLPNREHNQDLMAMVAELPENRLGDKAVIAVFAADPFLNCNLLVSHLAAKGYTQVANLPPVGGYGAEFLATLANVGSGRVRERRALERLAESGLEICPAVADRQGLKDALNLNPALLWVSPDFDMCAEGELDPEALLALCQETADLADIPVILAVGGSGISREQAMAAGASGMLLG